MQNQPTLHNLTHAAMDDLQNAFAKCGKDQAEGLILSAIVTVRKLHDLLPQGEEITSADSEPEEYCCAI